MRLIKLWRLFQLFLCAWKDSSFISKESKKNRIKVFSNIISCFQKFYVFSNQYKTNELWKLNKDDFESTANNLGNTNLQHDQWILENYDNHKFLGKWTHKKWENNPKRIRARNNAYTKFFNAGKDLSVQYNVEIRREHYLSGSISIGEDVLFAKNVFIDYSGELILEDSVKLSDGVVIETHRHEFIPGSKSHKAIPTRVIIEEGVWVGQKAVICEEVKRIGRFAQIGAGTVVRNPIPPYAIVVGNPAKIVGFLYTPEEVSVFEKDKYPVNKRTDIEKYTKQYEKYFVFRMKEIKRTINY